MSTPDGELIDTFTLWLSFEDEGECALSLDLTGFNAAMRRLRAVTDPCGGNTAGGSGCSCDPPFGR